MDRLRRRVRGRPLLPGNLPNLMGARIWYDPSKVNTLTDAGGGLISNVLELTPNGDDATQPDNARRPQTGVVTIGGLNALRFQSDQLIVPNNSNDDMDIFIVCRVVTGLGSNGQWWGNGGLYDAEQAGAHPDWGSSVQASGLLGFGFGPGPAGGDSTAKTPASVLGQDMLVNLTRGVAPDLRQIRINGALVVNGTTGGRTNTRNGLRRTIGSIQTNNNYMPEMWWGEHVVFDRILNGVERTTIEAYFGRWGV